MSGAPPDPNLTGSVVSIGSLPPDVNQQTQPPVAAGSGGVQSPSQNLNQQTQPPIAAQAPPQNVNQQVQTLPTPPVGAGAAGAQAPQQNASQTSPTPTVGASADAGDVEAPPQNQLLEPLIPPPAGGGSGPRGGAGGQAPVFRGTAALANQLPTGTVLAFQILSPVFTNMGSCDIVYQTCTWALLVLCSLSCVILGFTDSFIDDDGMLRYVFATLDGMWVIDGSPEPPPGVAARYRLKFMDFAHAFMTLAIFVAVAVLDNELVLCLYPDASSYLTLALKLVPLFIALICSVLFIKFPTARHGIGFPISSL